MKTPEEMMGIVECQDRPIIFHHNNYVFSFMTDKVFIYPNSEFNGYFLPDTVDGFTKCITREGTQLLIDTGDSQININRGFRTPFLIYRWYTDKTTEHFFEGMSFVGGTLNKLFPQNAVIIDSPDFKKIEGHIDNDKQTYEVKEEDLQCTISIRTIVKGTYSIQKGNSIQNDDVELSIHFSEKQKLSALYKYYECVMKMLSFMCFREEVEIDEVYLLQNKLHADLTKPIPTQVYQVYIPQQGKFTEKNIRQNIGFSELSQATAKLFYMFYNFKEEKPTYSLNFYPKNDDVIGIMTMDRIRSICSGLECELAFQKSLMTEEDKELENLKKEVKNLIKAHRKGETPLQSKTYDLLFGSIDNWTASLYDRIVALYRKFEPEMQEIIRHNIPFEIDEQKIRDFVRYRNKTTHGSSKTLTHEIALTAHYLSGLVYLCVLERIGVDSDTRMKLCRENRIVNH